MRLSVSIVSHGQGHLISQLLGDLLEIQLKRESRWQILLTLNVKEDENFLSPFAGLDIVVIRNPLPKGFGANHNAAFTLATGDVFVVLNPDIRLREMPEELMSSELQRHDGVWAPLILSNAGNIEDSFRRFPTVIRLARRALLSQRGPDYVLGDGPMRVDWVAGMFMAFTRRAFASVKGFDERYFMYMEDADICRRLSRRGLAVTLDPRARAVHNAQRASRRNWQHRRWHLRSAARFLLGI